MLRRLKNKFINYYYSQINFNKNSHLFVLKVLRICILYDLVIKAKEDERTKHNDGFIKLFIRKCMKMIRFEAL